jgi:sec-independent protein translocase protein TatA
VVEKLLLIAGVVVLMFGGKKLPEMMKGLGQGVRSFKEGLKEPTEEEKKKESEKKKIKN